MKKDKTWIKAVLSSLNPDELTVLSSVASVRNDPNQNRAHYGKIKNWRLKGGLE